MEDFLRFHTEREGRNRSTDGGVGAIRVQFGYSDQPVHSLSFTTNRDVWRCAVRCVQTHQDVVVTDGDCASRCEEEFKKCNVSSPPKFEAEACELSSSACG